MDTPSRFPRFLQRFAIVAALAPAFACAPGPGGAPLDAGEKCHGDSLTATVLPRPPIVAAIEAESVAFAITFSDPVTGLSSAGATGGASVAITGEGADYEAVVTGLVAGEKHTVTLPRDGIADACGRGLDADLVVPIFVGTTSVKASSPAEGASDVATDLLAIDVEFSGAMDEASGPARLVRKLDGRVLAEPVARWRDGGTRASFDVSLVWFTANTPYALELGGLRSARGAPLDGAPALGDGRLDFTTGRDGPSLPKALGTRPYDGERHVSTAARAVTVLFAQPMDTTRGTATIAGGSVSLGAATWNADATIASFELAGPLVRDTNYEVTFEDFTGAEGEPIDPTTLGREGRIEFTTTASAGEQWTRCALAYPLQNDTIASPYSFPIEEATNEGSTESCGSLASGEDLISSYTMGAGHTHLEVTIAYSLLFDSLYTHHEIWADGCTPALGGSEVACRFSESGKVVHVFEATPGTTYFFKSLVVNHQDGFETYAIKVREFSPRPDPWESCETAYELQHGVVARPDLSAIDDRLNEGVVACGLETQAGMNLVSKYTMSPASRQTALRVTTKFASDNFFNPYATIVSRNACTAAQGRDELVCSFENVLARTYEFHATPGSTYFFDTVARLTGQLVRQYEIRVDEFTPTHSDWTSCSTAKAMQNGVEELLTAVPAELTNDGVGSCGQAIGMDLVASYTTQGLGAYLKIEADAAIPGAGRRAFEVWRGACEPAQGTELACVESPEPGFLHVVPGIQPGETYFVKALATGSTAFSSYRLKLTEVTPTRATEDVDLDADASRETGTDACGNAFVEWHDAAVVAPANDVDERARGCGDADGGEVAFRYTVPADGAYTVDVSCPGCSSGATRGVPTLLVSKTGAHGSELFCGRAQSFTTAALAAGETLHVTVSDGSANEWKRLGSQDVRVRITRLERAIPEYGYSLAHAGQGIDGRTAWDLRSAVQAGTGCGRYTFAVGGLRTDQSHFEPACNTSGYFSAEVLLAWTTGASSTWLDVSTCGSDVETLLSAGADDQHTRAACNETACGLQSRISWRERAATRVLLTLASLSREDFGSFDADTVQLTVVEK